MFSMCGCKENSKHLGWIISKIRNILGVAFEQGKTLPTPETVPFRLTRDVVDGMGVAGVEGVFRRCCEKTMEVMRASQEELCTIVEVSVSLSFFWQLSLISA